MSNRTISLVRVYFLFAIFIALPLFEWRFVNYNLFGSHAISPFVILYFLLLIPLATTRSSYQTEEMPSIEFRVYFILIYISLVSFVVTWKVFAAAKTVGASTFTLVGMVAIFISTNILFSKNRVYIWKQVPRVVMCMAVIYPLLAILFLLLINGSSLIGYVDVVNRADFAFPVRPFQFAVVATFATLLGCAVCIGTRKENHAFWIPPLMGYVVALTGSKSGFAGFWILWAVFCVWIVRERIKAGGKTGGKKLAVRLACSMLVGFVVLLLLPQTNLLARYAAFIESPVVLSDKSPVVSTNYVLDISTPSDAVRKQLWRIALKNGPSSGQEPNIDGTNFGSFHNVFLDIYVSSGCMALFWFIAFLMVTAIALIRLLYLPSSSRERNIRFALLLCFVELVVQTFINPMLSFSVAWMMLGIITSSVMSPHLVNDKR